MVSSMMRSCSASLGRHVSPENLDQKRFSRRSPNDCFSNCAAPPALPSQSRASQTQSFSGEAFRLEKTAAMNTYREVQNQLGIDWYGGVLFQISG